MSALDATIAREAEPRHATDYWSLARRPLSCLVFLVPLLVVYEAGVLMLADQDPEQLRNGADYWMRDWLAAFGLEHAFLLPLLVLGGLLAWHLNRRYPWRVRPETLAGMVAESLMFACVLVIIGQVHNMLFSQLPELKEMAVAPTGSRVIAFIGAGVYEEVLFRLCLLPVVFGFFRVLEFPARGAGILAVLSTSFVFALAHYIGPAADHFSLFSFSFRALAGAFFAGLFFVRGFGITVGTHAAYDLLVGVLFASAA